MIEHTYLIVGGGMTTAAAVNGIRAIDEDGDIAVINAETHLPYDRPPLSKQLWTGKKTLNDIWRPTPDGVTFYLGHTVVRLDLARKEVRDNRGNIFRFQKLLLATGGQPRRLPFGNDKIVYFRNLNDFQRLRDRAREADRFAVIGGGFIGSELAAALAMNGKQVTMLFPEPGISARLFPEDLAAFLNRYYREKGVEVLTGETVVGLTGKDGDLTLHTGSGRQLNVDGVVAGIGIVPHVRLAQEAGLDVADGIVVDSSLRTSHADVYAAGDVAYYYDEALRCHRRVEHEDAANSMGDVAGRAMAGADLVYDHTPAFYSDMFDLGYEAVGRLDSSLETVAHWEEPYHKGIVYYLDQKRVQGVLLWNVWGKIDEARNLLTEQPTYLMEASVPAF